MRNWVPEYGPRPTPSRKRSDIMIITCLATHCVRAALNVPRKTPKGVLSGSVLRSEFTALVDEWSEGDVAAELFFFVETSLDLASFDSAIAGSLR